ncbi:AAA family ATPase [Shewanella atlantica]|uniref:AAA family ATPase n=1 Tax=Shewanella atlantica TaxID=271099 RepID=A0A3S0IGG1_9GAMM|nr:AAA family ATPase [Shewanella atlantica]RTR33363.1 AAA family ATPase [Shewanella atlantica]
MQKSNMDGVTHLHRGRQLVDDDVITIAPRPKTIADTGVAESVLYELMLKHLLGNGVLTKAELVAKMGITGGIIQQLLDSAKKQAWVENRQTTNDGQMRYALSHHGEEYGKQASAKSGYRGLTPVPLSQYTEVCKKQSSRNNSITFEMLKEGLSALVLPQQLLHKIGPALNSSRPVLIYGPPGTGKSYLCRNLNHTLGDSVLIPYAISIGNEVIQVYDPQLHHRVDKEEVENSLDLVKGHDPRWIKCKRPLRITGGELTAEMLEVQFDSHSRTYMAPIQLKANNGILLLDDLGRQRISAKQLFNRWIIPMEERRDFLALQSGEHFEIPFELILLFSTNLNPKELVDDAFLRRLGYKIHFDALAEPLYREIWYQECREKGLSCSEEMYQHLLVHYHQLHQKPLIPCYPRDLLGIMSDQISFLELEPEVTKELMAEAWSIYFV